MSFVERHGLWSQEQKEAASRLRKIVEDQKLEVIRLSFPDQHGILRGKTLVASEALASLESGCSITTTMLAKDTSHRTVFPVFTAGGGFGMKEMEGAADVLMVARRSTAATSNGWRRSRCVARERAPERRARIGSFLSQRSMSSAKSAADA